MDGPGLVPGGRGSVGLPLLPSMGGGSTALFRQGRRVGFHGDRISDLDHSHRLLRFFRLPGLLLKIQAGPMRNPIFVAGETGNSTPRETEPT